MQTILNSQLPSISTNKQKKLLKYRMSLEINILVLKLTITVAIKNSSII